MQISAGTNCNPKKILLKITLDSIRIPLSYIDFDQTSRNNFKFSQNSTFLCKFLPILVEITSNSMKISLSYVDFDQ